MPVHNVSELTSISDHIISRVLDTYIELAKKKEDYSDINIIGMDEASIARGHDYITLFVDLVEELEAKQGDRKEIKQVSCDMSLRLL